MANENKPHGFRAVRHLSGGVVQTNEYTIAAAYATNIFRGDVVEQVTGGDIEQAEATSADCIGVFDGCRYKNASGEQIFSPYWPSDSNATEIKAFVYDDPNIIFRVQGDATGHAKVKIFGQSDHTVAAGDVKTGVSKTILSTTVGTTGNFRILRLVNDGENAWGAYNDLEVIFAEHVFSASNAGLA